MEHKGWAGSRPHHKKPPGLHQVSLGIPFRSPPAGLSLQIPSGLSPPKASNASTDDRVSSSALERTKSLNEMSKGTSPELLQELYEKGKDVQHLTSQRDELRAKVASLLDQLKPLRVAAQGVQAKDQTIEQLQQAVLASKYEVASLRHQLGLYESTSKEICRVLERGHLSREERIHVLNCIRNAAKDSHTLQSSRSSPALALDDTGEFDQLFSTQQRESKGKGKLSGLKSPYRAPPASLTTLSRQFKGNASVKRLLSPVSLLRSPHSVSSLLPLDQQCQALCLRLKTTLEGWQRAYERKLVS